MCVMTCGSCGCSQAYGLQQFYQQTQDQLRARRDMLPSSSPSDRPVLDGDVTTMAVKFERSVHETQRMQLVSKHEWD